MIKLLLIFTVYILSQPVTAEPLHGYLNQQQTPLVGHVIEDKGLHGNIYLVNAGGLVFWRISRHPDTALLKRGDRILAIDGHKFNLSFWRNLMYDTTYHLTVKHKDKTIEDIPWFRMTPLEYEQNR